MAGNNTVNDRSLSIDSCEYDDNSEDGPRQANIVQYSLILPVNDIND